MCTVDWGRACSNRLMKDGINRMVNGLCVSSSPFLALFASLR
jgi:hypothetical protein